MKILEINKLINKKIIKVNEIGIQRYILFDYLLKFILFTKNKILFKESTMIGYLDNLCSKFDLILIILMLKIIWQKLSCKIEFKIIKNN